MMSDLQILKEQCRGILAARILFLLAFLFLICPVPIAAQSSGGLSGQVLDPSGALVPDAVVTITQGGSVLKTRSGSDGLYSFRTVPEGTWSVTVDV